MASHQVCRRKNNPGIFRGYFFNVFYFRVDMKLLPLTHPEATPKDISDYLIMRIQI